MRASKQKLRRAQLQKPRRQDFQRMKQHITSLRATPCNKALRQCGTAEQICKIGWTVMVCTLEVTGCPRAQKHREHRSPIDTIQAAGQTHQPIRSTQACKEVGLHIRLQGSGSHRMAKDAARAQCTHMPQERGSCCKFCSPQRVPACREVQADLLGHHAMLQHEENSRLIVQAW